jgi:hypothetical protein
MTGLRLYRANTVRKYDSKTGKLVNKVPLSPGSAGQPFVHRLFQCVFRAR